jgi:signal peptidase I
VSAALSRGAVAVLLACVAGAWVLRRRVAVVTVSGDSMRPTFQSGDRVLVRRAGPGQLSTGMVVVIEKPAGAGHWLTPLPRWPGRDREWMIKRVAAVAGDPLPALVQPELPLPELPLPELPLLTAVARRRLTDPPGTPVPAGQLVVLGDNPGGSFDSRVFGYCPAERVLGVVLRPLRTARPAGASSAVFGGVLRG